LVLENTVQNRLGEEVYGSYFVVFNFSLLFTIIMDMGMNSMITREVASGKHPVMLWKAGFPVKLLLSAAYAVFTILVGLSQGLPITILLLVVLNQMLLQWILMFRAYLQGAGKGRTDAWFSVLDRVIAILLCLALIRGSRFSGREGLMWFALCQTAGYAVALVFIAWKVHRELLRNAYVVEGGNLPIGAVLRGSLGFALLALLMAGFTRVDALMLQMLMKDGSFQAGVYARGFRLLDAGLIFPVLMSTLLLPAFTAKAFQRKELSQLAETGTMVMLLVALPAAALGFFYAGPLMGLLNPDATSAQGISVLAWLMLAYLPMSMVYVFGTLLTALKKLRLLIMLACCSLALNMLLNLVLIPRFGALGTAWSAAATQSFFCLSCIWFSRGELNGFSALYIVKILLSALCCAALAFLLSTLGWVWYAQAIGALALWLLLLLSGKLHPDLHLKQFLSGRGAQG